MTARLASVLGLISMLAQAGRAQAPLEPGAYVRRVPAEQYEPQRRGRVVADSATFAIVRFEPDPIYDLRASTEQVPHARLEVRTRLQRNSRFGAVLGGAATAAAGVVVGSNAFGDLCEGNSFYGTQRCGKDTSMAIPLFVAGGIVGAGVGALFGHAIKSETWRPLLTLGLNPR